MDNKSDTLRPKAYSYLRMSTMAQDKGDSRRRQRKAAEEYASEHNLDLVNDYEDIGLSGWTGANIESGVFGRFLLAVRQGEVPKGSYLLVEALDRISRQEPARALQPFLDLINNGIVLVTLSDKKVFRSPIRFEDLLISIVYMSRGNNESEQKSQRVAAAWKNKRSLAADVKLTKKCPGWLKLSDDRRSFEVLEDRAEVVRRIFDETVSGMGVYSIARRLNAEGVQPFGKTRGSGKGWQLSSIQKIINSRSVFGEVQLGRMKEGRRILDGEPIKGYFPTIVSEDQFNAAYIARKSRREGGGGRTGKRVSNLFSKLAFCLECDSPMHFVSKGSGPKGGAYLICDSSRRNTGCKSGGWKYRDFESSFLAFVSELDLGTVLEHDTNAAERRALESKLASLNGRIAVVQSDLAAAFTMHKERGLKSTGEIMAKCEEEIEQLAAQVNDVNDKLVETSVVTKNYYESAERLHALIRDLREHAGSEVYKQRSLVSARLKAIISKILVCADGGKSVKGRALDVPHFAVILKKDAERWVFPDPANPLKFVWQTVSAGKEFDVIEADGRIQSMAEDFNSI